MKHYTCFFLSFIASVNKVTFPCTFFLLKLLSILALGFSELIPFPGTEANRGSLRLTLDTLKTNYYRFPDGWDIHFPGSEERNKKGVFLAVESGFWAVDFLVSRVVPVIVEFLCIIWGRSMRIWTPFAIGARPFNPRDSKLSRSSYHSSLNAP